MILNCVFFAMKYHFCYLVKNSMDRPISTVSTKTIDFIY